jgi:hypothetical protein
MTLTWKLECWCRMNARVVCLCSLSVKFTSHHYMFASSSEPIREVTHFRETHTHTTICHTFHSTTLSTRSSPSCLVEYIAAKTVGLWNPISWDFVWERGDRVFGEHFCTTTDLFFITNTDDYFLDFDKLLGEIGNNSNANANGFSSALYVSLFLFIEFVF